MAETTTVSVSRSPVSETARHLAKFRDSGETVAETSSLKALARRVLDRDTRRVRRLLVEVERYKSHGYAHGEIQMLQMACEAVLAAHPGGNWRRARLGSIVGLVILAEQVRAYHDTPHPRNAAWLGSEQTPLSGLH